MEKIKQRYDEISNIVINGELSNDFRNLKLFLETFKEIRKEYGNGNVKSIYDLINKAMKNRKITFMMYCALRDIILLLENGNNMNLNTYLEFLSDGEKKIREPFKLIKTNILKDEISIIVNTTGTKGLLTIIYIILLLRYPSLKEL